MAGSTNGRASKGGSIIIAAGDASNNDEGDGGNGGVLVLTGGFANGNAKIDAAGDAIFRGGDCKFIDKCIASLM